MILADSHTHLYLEQFDHDRSIVVENAIAMGVQYMLLPNIDRDSIPGMLALADSYPENCIPMMGLHPTSVKADFRLQLEEVEKWLSQRAFCAVGETGIDLYWDKTFRAEQEIAFRQQIRLAAKYDLPVVIHSRNSFKEIIAILEEEKHDALRGVFHCFSGDEEDAVKAISLGFMLGIGGVLTYKNSGLGEVLKKVSLNHLLLETDAPFLAPVPHRGKRNESAFLPEIARKMAEILGASMDEIAEVTAGNAKRMFAL
ncbi:MAG: TatD family hydrolase [Bacteroidales bacterium]|nr:TatD family hydrolase [Bacteroidales bacterium]